MIAYAVFDGHGGKQSRYSPEPRGCVAGCCERPLPTSTEIEDAFWKVDAECGRRWPQEVATAAVEFSYRLHHVLFVEALPSKPSKAAAASGQAAAAPRPGGYKCIWAWTGDSTGITVDMASGKLGPCTANHVPDSEVEAANLRLMEAVGKAVLKGKSKSKDKDKGEKKDKKAKNKKGDGDAGAGTGNGDTAEEVEPVIEAAPPAGAPAAEEEEEADDTPITLPDVLAAMKAANLKPTPTCSPQLLVRALERERLIAQAIPKGRKYRRNAVMQRRPKAKDENEPMVVATHDDPYSSH